MSKTIKLKGEFIRKEVVATGVVKPGHGVSLLGAVAGAGSGRKAFALENDLVGEGVDDAYAVGDTIQCGVFEPGAEVYAWLEAGANVAKGAALQFNANGEMEALAAGILIGYALEAINNSASGAVPVRIKIEIA